MSCPQSEQWQAYALQRHWYHEVCSITTEPTSLIQVLLTLKLALTYTFTHTHTHTKTHTYLHSSLRLNYCNSKQGTAKSARVESWNEETGLLLQKISLKNEWMTDKFLDNKNKIIITKNYKIKTHLPSWGISVPNAALLISCPAQVQNTHDAIADNTQTMVSLYIPIQHCQ